MSGARTPTLDVVTEPTRAQAMLAPARQAILAALGEPASAALGKQLGIPRQRLNYHLRELEAHGLVTLVEERKRGSVTERIYRRTGDSYTISPATLGPLAASPDRMDRDQYSAAYQIALCSRAVSEVAALREGAARAGKKLPTFSLEVDVAFPTAKARNAFTEELAQAIADLVEKHHVEGPDGAGAPKGARAFRFFLGSYPVPKGD